MPPPTLLILIHDPDTAQSLALALRRQGANVWLSGERPPAGVAIELVLTDLPPADAAMAGELPLDELLGLSEQRSTGVVGLGQADWGDVSLGDDYHERELWLACQLLAEIVRLRRDRMKLRRQRDHSEQLAQLDSLTGAPARRVWDARLAEACQGHASKRGTHWVAIVDLDGFKSVNETRGHPEGDDVLRQVAQAMANAVGSQHLLARLGGDEFGVLLTDADESGAVATFDRLRTAVHQTGVPNGCARLTASIGYVALGEQPVQTRQAMAAADLALRAAKRAGGNRAVRGMIEPPL
ncbi:MAG: GGDEF domain-containing protein [Pirellulales bacterium]